MKILRKFKQKILSLRRLKLKRFAPVTDHHPRTLTSAENVAQTHIEINNQFSDKEKVGGEGSRKDITL